MGNTSGRLSGKVAIITGATGGIGEATAKLFLDEGAKVMLIARSEEKLKATRDRLGEQERLDGFIADAMDEAATAAAVAATVEKFGGLDILFANAGVEGITKPLDELTMDDFAQVLNTNVLGVWLSMKYCIAPMKVRGGGSIIATASIAGAVGFPHIAPYVSSKHAVNGLVKTSALELGEFGIRVNAVSPGPIDNRMMRSLGEQLSPDDPAAFREDVNSQLSLGRYGTDEEVAKLVTFLASDDASYCTGSAHMIDGGYVAA